MIFCIKDFEGPLDLLLHLVKTAKMDIYEIDTKYIIDEYLRFIDSLDKEDIDNASEYLVMAAELIHLKSRLLLNLDETDDSDNDEFTIHSEEDLKNKLIEYERYQNATVFFKELEEKRGEFFTKTPENISAFKVENDTHIEEDVSLLVDALLELQKRLQYQKPVHTKITRKEISVEERTSYIRGIIEKRKKISFQDLFDVCSKELLVVTFLSILDMCKNKEIVLKQEANFDDILIEKVVL